MINSVRFLLIISMGILSLNLQAAQDQNSPVSILENLRASVAHTTAYVQTAVNGVRATCAGTSWAYDNKKGIAITGCALTGAGMYGSYKLRRKLKRPLKYIGQHKITALAGCYLAYQLLSNDETKQLIIDCTTQIIKELADLKEFTQNSVHEILNRLDEARTEREELARRQEHADRLAAQNNQMLRELMEQQGRQTPPSISPREGDSLDQLRKHKRRDTDIKIEPKPLQGRGNIFTRAWNWFAAPAH